MLGSSILSVFRKKFNKFNKNISIPVRSSISAKRGAQIGEKTYIGQDKQNFDSSFDSQHMFWLINKKINFYLLA